MSHNSHSSTSSPSRARLTGSAIIGSATSLGTPLRTRTVNANGEEIPSVPQQPVAAKTPVKASSTAFGSSLNSTASRLAKTPPRSTAASSSSSSSSIVITPTSGSSRPSSKSSSSSSAAAASSSSSSPAPKSTARMISRQRYDASKTSDVFSTKTRYKSSFGEAYANGRIPARVNHGSVRHTLQWDVPSHEIDLAWMLPVVADGLVETEHPCCYIARQAFKELLIEAGQARVKPLLPKLIQPLRRALMDSSDGVFESACDAVVALSQTAGPLLNEHLDLILAQINKKGQGKLAAKVSDTISALAENGGEESITIIKKRVPAFSV